MREIKFRAWDVVEKRFWYFTLQEILERRMSYRGSWDEKVLNGEKTQYTGLKDKNGREIYEGDILNCIDFKLRVSYICRVAWKERGYWYTYNTEGKSIGFLRSAELPEIIGNIYENPELLEVSQ